MEQQQIELTLQKKEIEDRKTMKVDDHIYTNENNMNMSNTVIIHAKNSCSNSDLICTPIKHKNNNTTLLAPHTTSKLQSVIETVNEHAVSPSKRAQEIYRNAFFLPMQDCQRERLALETAVQKEMYEFQQYQSNVNEQIVMAMHKQSKLCVDYQTRFLNERSMRMLYLQQLIELQGNIRVFARVRPTSTKNDEKVEVYKTNEDCTSLIVNDKTNGKAFEFDKVFSATSTQSNHDIHRDAHTQTCINIFLEKYICMYLYLYITYVKYKNIFLLMICVQTI